MTHTERRDRRRQIAEAVLCGMEIGKVARDFGIAMAGVYAACREHDVQCALPSTRRRNAILAALRDGYSPRDGALMRGVTVGAVRVLANRHGLRLRGMWPNAASRKLRIIADLLNTRSSYANIARQHKVSRQAVSEIGQDALAAGIPITRRIPNGTVSAGRPQANGPKEGIGHEQTGHTDGTGH